MVALKKVQGGVRGQSPSLSNIGNKRREKKKGTVGQRERRKKEREKEKFYIDCEEKLMGN